MAWAQRASQQRLQMLAERAIRKSADPSRHKCFVSYHVDDTDEVAAFIEDHGAVFIPTVVGITEDDDFVDSENIDYIMDRIRERHLSDTTVTIVLVGKCTWARRFVDWEIYASLRKYDDYFISGLMGITLPSVADDDARQLPPRLADNVDGDKKYARCWKYPTSTEQLRRYIQEAYDARKAKAEMIDNSRPRKRYSSSCP